MSQLLFSRPTMGPFTLQNRVVMAPMTRSRSPGNVPGPLVAEYYRQRADVGLVITEGTSPSPDGLGYMNIPGAYSDAQAAGWKGVADAVHARGAHLFVQLMHTGRVGHPLNLPAGAELVAPSAVAAPGQMHTVEGPKDYPTPRALTTAELPAVIQSYVDAAKKLVAAGVDGVELHAANGYLLEQFLSPVTNLRDDDYGGSVDNRHRFVVDVTRAVVDAIGGGRVGIRLSPHGTNGGMTAYDGIDESYLALAGKLAETGVQYLHVVDHSGMGAPPVPQALRRGMRAAFPRTFILCGGFTQERATAALLENEADLIAFGRPILANPDFVGRLQKGLPLNAVDFSTLYTPGEKGYVDYR